MTNEILRIIFKWSSWFLVGFLVFYIYVVAFYFIYSNQDRVIDSHIHPIHEHQIDKRFAKQVFGSQEEIVEYRRKRFEKARNRDPNYQGPGEDGRAVILDAENQKLADKLFAKETFNVIASNIIAMDRRLPDLRPADCKTIKYPEKLPDASVIMVFCNEAPSALLRTVHSVINRSPPQYLREVILVDDASERPETGEELENYIDSMWPDGIVKLFRSKERLGLIRGRMVGAEKAVGDVMIFLDAHCEATDYWIEPILHRIAENPKIVIVPMIDGINDKDLQFNGGGGIAVGGFSWGLHYTWRGVPPGAQAKRHSDADPAESPSMPGGLFAADRKFFFDLGGYDKGMDVWGGENLEISFRTWMCGGSMEFLPCSRVGHIFRGSHPYSFLQKDTHGLNSKRLAEVWMDDYKRLYYILRPDLKEKDAGNYSDRIELRKRLNCKSFKWFLENVYPEKFIPDENVYSYGMVRNPETNLCLDTLGKDDKGTIEIGLYFCQGGKSPSEVFSMSKKDELRREETCADAPQDQEGSKVLLLSCHGQGGNQAWRHDKTTGEIRHLKGEMCLDVKGRQNNEFVYTSRCNGSPTQKWTFQYNL